MSQPIVSFFHPANPIILQILLRFAFPPLFVYINGTVKKELPKVIEIDEDKCVNCHHCIAVCPIKYCNDGSGDVIKIDDDMCIGCGECLHVCSHDARRIHDDFDDAMTALKKKEKIIACVAPAVASNFPNEYLHLNGWLKSLGVSAVFDVSFGAELAVKSYIEHLNNKHSSCVISQPCPAIVTYIEIYQPELLPYLAPVDSPMMHAMKMIRKYYPKYRKHKLMVISPCIAKKREFVEVGVGDYNVTFAKIQKNLEDHQISLTKFKATDFDNPPAERAVGFSSPGGLLDTAKRESNHIDEVTRKLEGVPIIYNYLELLPEQIKHGRAPLLIDCLNCLNGCNGGTGTNNNDKSPDEIEFFIQKRRKAAIKHYECASDQLTKTLQKYWDKTLYQRQYHDRSRNDIAIEPTQEDTSSIYRSMHKYNDEDIKNCASCGYNYCEKMAKAIYNSLNKKENCYFYINYKNEKQAKRLEQSNKELEQFAYIASHDLQEPLRMVSSYLQLLEKRNMDSLDSDSQDFMHFAVDGAKRMSRLIHNLLKFSRATRYNKEFQLVDINHVVYQALNNLQVKVSEKQAKISYKNLPAVEGDISQLIQLFQNLIDNALKYTHDDTIPNIAISSKPVEKDRLWHITVKDNGIGIDPDRESFIFQMFRRLHVDDSAYKGSGIGLAVCKKIVERHSGTIWVESKGHSKGSVLHLTLPMVEESNSLKTKQ